jgi:hypothetical protein
MWIEDRPTAGDTVQVNLILPIETIIGIFERYFDGRAIINIGKRKLYVDSGTTFFIWKN